MKEFLDTVVADPGFVSGYHFISDLRDYGDPDHFFVITFAKEVRQRASVLAPCRWAIVVANKGAAAAVHLLNVLTFGTWVEFGAFLRIQDAVEWVDAGTAEWLALDDLR